MAKKAKKKTEEVIKEEEILVDPILVDEDLLYSEEKPKIFIGYHPITGLEIWQ